MNAIAKVLAGGIGIAALASAAPAAAQYYPGYPYGGYGYPYGNGNVVGQVLNQVLGGGYGYNGYGGSQVAINQCAAAVQARLSGSYGGYGYNGYGYGGGRVLGISRIERRSNGGLTVRGVATSGRYARYGYGQGAVDTTWKCKTDYRGFVTDVDLDRVGNNYGYGNYSPYDYSQYGYRRY